MDFNAGNKQGRIYRIVPKNAPSFKKVPVDLRKAKSIDLVAMLSHQSRWWRLTAQRLLLERQDKTVISAVRDIIDKSQDPRFRLHAIYVLEGMNVLDAEIVKKAMKDPADGVRENAAILSERFPQCLPQLKEMVNDSSMRVALQATLSLGEFNDPSLTSVYVKVLERHGESSWFRTAVLSSPTGSSTDFLNALSHKGSFFNNPAPWKLQFLHDFAVVAGARNQKAQITALLETIPSANSETWQPAVVKGLTKGLENSKGINDSMKESLKNIAAQADANTAKAVQDLKATLL
jgi:hypothetical protein